MVAEVRRRNKSHGAGPAGGELGGDDAANTGMTAWEDEPTRAAFRWHKRGATWLRRAARTVGDARAMTMAPAEVAPASSVRREALSCMDKAFLTSKGICAVTYFRGDATSARCALAERLRLVLEANPWLAGRLVQHKRVVCLEWHEAPAAEALAAAAAVALHAPPGGCGLRYGCTYQQLHSAIVDTPLEVPIALKLVNKDAPLFRLSVVPDCNSDGKAAFALVVTVSHAVVDGRAFYEIHNMLSEGAHIHTLDPTRPDDAAIDTAHREAFGSYAVYFQLYLFLIYLFFCYIPSRVRLAVRGTLPKALYGMLFGDGSQARVACRLVSNKAVARAKAAAAAEGTVPWVSTNDVITSAFFKGVGCNIGGIAVDCRRRLPIAPADGASNLENLLIMNAEDFAMPALVRRSVDALCRANGGRFPWLRTTRLPTITSWTAFSKGTVIPGCQHRLHIPYFVRVWKAQPPQRSCRKRET